MDPDEYPWDFKGIVRTPSVVSGHRYFPRTPHLEFMEYDTYAGMHYLVGVSRGFLFNPP